jgi:alternate signal-mediated exported protein
MNKMIKGSIAGATGIALLMGGFGTYALWSDSENLAASSITSGELDVAAGAVNWKDQTNAVWSASDLMVPGDTVTRSQQFTFKATGKNMKGTIRFAPGALTPHVSGNDAFTINVAVAGLTNITGAGGCWEFAVGDMPETADTSVTYALTADAQDLQNVTAAIAASTFTVQQGDSCA